MELDNLPRPPSMADAVLLTHQGCMDGSACALVFIRAGGKKENVTFVPAGKTDELLADPAKSPLGDPRFLLFADIAPLSESSLAALEKRGNCAVIDHHKSSSHLKGLSFAHVDCEGNGGSACGSMLLYRYLQKLLGDYWNLRMFVKVVDDQDRWIRKELPLSENMASLSSFMGQERFLDRCLRTKGDELFLMTPFEKELLEILIARRDDHVRTSVDRAIVREVYLPYDPLVGKNKVTIAYTFSHSQDYSHLLNKLLEAKPEADVAAFVDLHRRAVSFRSRAGGVDCASLAKIYGGGGHLGAAGHPFSEDVLKRIAEDLHG